MKDQIVSPAELLQHHVLLQTTIENPESENIRPTETAAKLLINGIKSLDLNRGANRVVSLLIRSPHPEWPGMMHAIYKGTHLGMSSAMFLLVIDMHPGYVSCIYSILVFVCEHVARYSLTYSAALVESCDNHPKCA